MARPGLVTITLVLTLVFAGATARGQSTTQSGSAAGADAPDVAPIVIDGQQLFSVRGVSAFPAARRASEIRARIEAVARDRRIDTSSITVEERPEGSVLVAGGRPFVTVLDEDAALEQVDRPVLAQAYLLQTRTAVETFRRDREPRRVLTNAGLSLGATIVTILVLAAGHRLLRRLRLAVAKHYHARVSAVSIREFQVVPAAQIWRVLSGLLDLAGVFGVLTVVLFYLEYVLLLFPWTRGLGNSLVDMMIAPVRTLADGFVAQVPNVAFLVVLFVVTRYVLKTVKLFFEAVGQGTVTLSEFEPEWSLPTYRLVRMAIVALALVVAYPYIPGSESAAFQGLTLFVGVLFSLGSSSVIANIIAGYSITYRRAFRIGDRVKIGEHVGAVERVRLMVTHLRTPKNEEVIVPNSSILTNEVVNFSSLAASKGLILHTTVGIGYETPWRQVEAMLLEAAARTPDTLRDPAPFVLERALGDFAVTYEINVHTAAADRALFTYADLHRNILDVFNEYGVQIMTPAYEGDPEQPKVVSKNDWYASPARKSDGAPGQIVSQG